MAKNKKKKQHKFKELLREACLCAHFNKKEEEDRKHLLDTHSHKQNTYTRHNLQSRDLIAKLTL